MNLQELLKMNLFERHAPTNNSAFTRVPGGWVYGDLQGCCFVPEPPEVIHIEALTKKTVSCPLNAQTTMNAFFESQGWHEVDRVATGGMMSQPEILITYAGRLRDFDNDKWIELLVELKLN